MTGQPLVEAYDEIAGTLPSAELDWLGNLRQRGLASYRAHGMPNRKVEAWRYTNLNRLVDAGLVAAAAAPTPADDPAAAPLELADAHTIGLVNGRLRADLSALDGLPEGVSVTGLADALARAPAAIAERLGRLAAIEDGPFVALNTAYLADGAVVTVAPGTRVERPIHVVSIGLGGTAALAFHPRLLVELGADATATLVESHVGRGTYLANVVAEIELARGAALTHVKLQDDDGVAFHLAALALEAGERASYHGFVLQAGAAIARHEAHLELAGAHGAAHLAGAYLVDGTRLVDNTTLVSHAAPDCLSRQLFKGVLDGAGRGVFQGKVLVRPGAQRTDGHQSSRALLLSPQAEIDAKPELEIYADDVKCSHGATAGALEPGTLFYLLARGIAPDVARRLLVEAFVGDAIEAIDDGAIAAAVSARVAGWLDGHLAFGALAAEARP